MDFYITLNLPQNCELKLLQNLTYNILFEPPENSCSIELKTQGKEQGQSCKKCNEKMNLRVFVTQWNKTEEVILPELIDVKTEDFDDDFDFCDSVQAKFEDEDLLLSFSARNPNDIMELYKQYPPICKRSNENFFDIGDERIFWERSEDQKIYFMTFDPGDRKCDICGSGKRSFTSLLKHRSSHCFEKSHGNVCKLCGFDCDDKSLLFKHALLCTEMPTVPEVDSIGEKLDSIYDKFKKKPKTYPYYEISSSCGRTLHFYQHKRSYTFYMTNFDPRPCKCDICAMEFKSIPSFLHHRRYHFFETGDLECAICKARFSTEATLGRHSLICPEKDKIKPFTCKFCEKSFNNYDQQRKHEIGHKKGWDRFAKPRMCHLCSKACDDTSTLTVHLRKVHEINPYRCEHCTKIFGDFTQLKFHIIGKHFPHLGEFACPKCPKLFPIQTRLSTHMKNRHCEGKPACQHCGRTFQNTGSLRTHIESFHTDFSARKKFCCESCGKVFFTKFALQSHTMTHKSKEEWPFQCKVCEKRFVNKYKWSDHEKVHVSGPQNVCSYCGKSFQTKIYLADHINLHTGAKPYECRVCQKRFSDRGNLRSHLKNHEKTMGLKLVLTPEERRLVRQRVVNSETILSK